MWQDVTVLRRAEVCGFQQVKELLTTTQQLILNYPVLPFKVFLLPQLSGVFLSMVSIISAYRRTCMLGVSKSNTGDFGQC